MLQCDRAMNDAEISNLCAIRLRWNLLQCDRAMNDAEITPPVVLVKGETHASM